MRSKNKGFTLIELLTVIAILAIILLISAPIILNVLEKSKKNNFRNQALLYVDGLKQNALLDSMSDNPNIVLPEVGKSLSINVDDITMDSNTNVTGNIVVTNKGNGNYSYILYITNGEYIICNKEYNKVTTNDIKKGNTCGDSLLYPTISNKYQTQTYNYKYGITKELILNGVTATDTRDGDITSKITYTGSVDTYIIGDYEIIYSVENSLGNISTTKRTIQVRDTEAPTITNTILKEEIDKGSTYNKYLEGITVEDNYDTGLEATYICKNGILQTIECSEVGSKAGVYYIIYDVKDTSNNKYSETSGEEIKREIVVKDIDAPEITLKGESTVTIEVGSTFTEPGYEAIDDEDGDVTANVETSSNLNTRVLGTYTVQYIVVDASENRGIATRTIQVVDTTKPEITAVTGNPSNWVTSATITVEATDNYKLHESPYSFDNGVTWQAGSSKQYTSNQEVNIKVRDAEGNISDTTEISTVSITKIDTEAPIINNSIASVTINKGTTYNSYLNGITVTDNSRENIEATYICKNGLLQTINCNIIGNRAGVYYIIYDAVDIAGNRHSTTSGRTAVKREIAVKDISAPVITLSGANPVTIEVGSMFTDPGYSALDDEDGNVTNKVETSSNLNTKVVGTYTVQYIVVDASGNRGVQTRTINVVDTTKPVITEVTGNPTTWTTSATLTVEASDNYKLHAQPYSFDNGVTWQSSNSKQFTTGGTVNIKVRDEAGNISGVSTVNITNVDSTTPSISFDKIPDRIKPKDSYQLPTSYTVNNSLSGGSVVCKDGNTVVTNTSSLNEGIHIINCTVTTGAGKTESASKTIVVSYKIGDEVTLKDNTTWYVIENSGTNSDTVTLFAGANIKNDASGWTTAGGYRIAFDKANARTTEINSYCTNPANGCNIYASNGTTVTEDSTIKKFIDGSVTTYINNSLTSNGGTVIKNIRLITTDEICNIINSSDGNNNCNPTATGTLTNKYTSVPSWLYSTNYWTMTAYASNSNHVYYVTTSSYLNSNRADYGSTHGARPVIVTLKSNIK